MAEVNRIKVVEQAEIDTSLWKISTIGAVGATLAALSGYALLMAFENENALYYFSSVAGLFIFLNIFILQTLLIKYFQTQIVIIIAEIAAFSAFFAQGMWQAFSGTFIVLFIVGVAIVILGARTGRKHLQTNLEVGFFDFSTKTLRNVANGLVLLIVLFYLSFNGAHGVPLSQEMLNATLRFSEPFTQKYLPALSFNSTMHEFLQDLALNVLSAEERRRLEKLTTESRAGLVSNAVQNLKTEINRYIDISNVNEEDPLSVALYRLIAEKFAAANRAVQTSILISGGILLFTILRLFVWPLTILVTFTSYVMYQILLALGFARITLETRTREMILMP